MRDRGWERTFDDPIALPDGRALKTLRDAGEHIASLPRHEQDQPRWHTAAEMLLMAAEGRGPVMHARIGMMRALNHDKRVTPPPERRKPAKKYRIVR